MSIDIVARAMAASAEGGGAEYVAGDNITISGNTISAVDTTYEAGDNITIENNVISAIGGGSSQLVEVFPDITTYEEITALLTDGKIPYIVEDRPDAVANWLKMIYIFNQKEYWDKAYHFYGFYIAGNTVPYFSCKQDNTWQYDSISLARSTDVFNKEYRLVAGTDNITIDRSDFRTKTTISVASDDTKQDKLTAGEGITIENNVISASGGTEYTAGNGIDITDGVISIGRTIPIFEGEIEVSDDYGNQARILPYAINVADSEETIELSKRAIRYIGNDSNEVAVRFESGSILTNFNTNGRMKNIILDANNFEEYDYIMGGSAIEAALNTKQNKATASTTDIGVGATLADGEIYLVYEE